MADKNITDEMLLTLEQKINNARKAVMAQAWCERNTPSPEEGFTGVFKVRTNAWAGGDLARAMEYYLQVTATAMMGQIWEEACRRRDADLAAVSDAVQGFMVKYQRTSSTMSAAQILHPDADIVSPQAYGTYLDCIHDGTREGPAAPVRSNVTLVRPGPYPECNHTYVRLTGIPQGVECSECGRRWEVTR